MKIDFLYRVIKKPRILASIEETRMFTKTSVLYRSKPVSRFIKIWQLRVRIGRTGFRSKSFLYRNNFKHLQQEN